MALPYNIGLNVPLSLASGQPALNKVYVSSAKDGRWYQIKDWNQWRRKQKSFIQASPPCNISKSHYFGRE